MSDEALKPCPFCGGEAKYYYYTPRDHNIECESCSNGTCLHETEAEAITAWNTRAEASEAQAKTIEALQADKAWLREGLNAIIDRGPERDSKWAGMSAKDIALVTLQETER